MFQRSYLFSLLVAVFMLRHVSAAPSDTIRLSLKEAEKRFLDQNFDLLMAKTDIDFSRGLLLQAKLFDNPYIGLNRQAYNYGTKEYFPGTRYQYEVDASQLITIAGKRIKRIDIAGQHVKLTEYEFYDVLRALKFELKENFYEVLGDQRKIGIINNGIDELDKLIDATKTQVTLGNVAKKELIRLQSLMLEFVSNRTELTDRIAQDEADLKKLLNYRGKEYLIPLLNDSTAGFPPKAETMVFDSLESMAFANRYDLLAASLTSEIGKNELQLAKKEAVPDINLGAQYDKYGTFDNGYFGLMIGLPIPLWNLNQGNVKAARAQYERLKLEKQKKELEIHAELEKQYARLLDHERLYNTANKGYEKSSEEIYKNIYDSYRNRTIGLIEFLEYFESYRNSKFNLIEIETSLRIESQRMNMELGKDIF